MSELKLRPPKALAIFAILIGLLSFVVLPAKSARRPRYGGTLRVEMGATVSSIDLTATPAGADEIAAKREIESLIYEKRNADGSPSGVAGSGPFRISEWQPGKHLTLTANDDFPGGRPFVDSIEIDMGRGTRDRLTDLELDRTDFIEIPAEDARAAAARGIRVSPSQPDELIALVFLANSSAVQDPRAREAVADSVDRSAIADFILQQEGKPAGGLLPQWSSGTEFLYPTGPDHVHAKELRAQIGASPEIRLGYDSGDAVEESIAERIAVDARATGMSLVAEATPAGQFVANSKQNAKLIRLPMQTARPGVALLNFLTVLDPIAGMSTAGPAEPDAEQIFALQKEALDAFRIVPLVWLPRVYGLSARVKDWQVPATGEPWPLADVWIDQPPKQN
jgi:peptide/nickel transport system substrate-binding protein